VTAAVTRHPVAALALPVLASRFVVGWLYDASGASVLIAGLFHATHNATVNPTGFGGAVLDLPQGEVLVVVGVLVMLAAVVVVFATLAASGSRSPRRRRAPFGRTVSIRCCAASDPHRVRSRRRSAHGQ
jgi:hypothetical protein